MSKLTTNNPSPPPRRHSPWSIAGGIILLGIVGYILFHCCRHCPPMPPPRFIAFSTVDTAGVDGINNGNNTIPLNKEVPLILGLFGPDGKTLADPKTTVGFQLEIQTAGGAKHPTYRIVSDSTGTFSAGNPVIVMSLTVTDSSFESVRRRNIKLQNDQANGIFHHAAAGPKRLVHRIALDDCAYLCVTTGDESIIGMCSEICPEASVMPTSTVHITVLGKITECDENGRCTTPDWSTQEYVFGCTAPGVLNFNNLHYQTNSAPLNGSIMLEFDLDPTVYTSYPDYAFIVTGQDQSTGPHLNFDINNLDPARWVNGGGDTIVHSIHLCNP